MSKLASSASISTFLGVERSALRRHWQWRLGAGDLREAEALAQIAGLPDALARILAGRGIGMANYEAYLEPRLRDLMPDPARLQDMDKAVALLRTAIQQRQKVAIFGDYDVDGACSAALLADYLRVLKVPFQIHIPDRIFEGYGPNIEAIKALAQNGAKLLVTVDCGATSFEPMLEARKLGLATLVLDHHQVGEHLPEVDALVNPNRQDDLSGLGSLCAAGVVFITLVALNRDLRANAGFSDHPEPDLFAMLDMVALATVADVVPLQGLNRAFVRQGLKIMRNRQRIGLSALMDVARLNRPVEPYHLGFLLGPRINAGGRIGDAALGAKLLLCEQAEESAKIAAELERLNRDRQVSELAMVEEAIAQAEIQIGLDAEAKGPAILITASEAWHPGIVGLVASRLKERFSRPCFAFALNSEGPNKGLGTGSARSVPGVDLGSAVRAAVDQGLLLKGGGHAMAAGATIETSRLKELQAFMEPRLADPVAQARAGDGLLVDAMMTASGATPDFLRKIERAGPFGQGNPEPIFVFPEHRLVECFEVGSEGHLRLKLKAGDGTMLGGIAFSAGGQPLGQFLKANIGEAIHIAGTLSLDLYGGREKVDLRVIDAAAI